MKINQYLTQKVIIITDHIHKTELLKYASEKHILLSCTIYTVEEIKQKYLFRYHENAILEIMQKEGVLPSTSEIYMEFLYYIEEKTYQNEKLQNLRNIYQYLQKKNYIIEDFLFRSYMKQKKIIFYALENIDKKEKKWLQTLEKENETCHIKEEENHFSHSLHIFHEAEEEIACTASMIAKSISQNEAVENIKVMVPNNAYQNKIKRIFNLYQIPFYIKEKKPLIAYDITKYFLQLIKEVEDSRELFSLLRECYDIKDDTINEIYQKLMQIYTNYENIEEKYKRRIIQYMCQKECIETKPTGKQVEVISTIQTYIEKEAHIYILGATLSYFPKTYQDDAYISDCEKAEITMDSTIEKNKKEEAKTYAFLANHKNITISYASYVGTQEYAKSSFVTTLTKEKKLIVAKEKNIYSKNYASFLLAKRLDEYTKYNIITKDLPILYNSLPHTYKTYNHQYKKAKTGVALSLIKNHITLSYTSLETFYQCKFRFYVQNILKVKEEKEESIKKTLGLLTHEILENINKCEEKHIIQSVLEAYFPMQEQTAKQKFFVEKYKQELKKMIAIIKMQKQRSSFIETYLEKEFYENIAFKNLQVKLTGKIDKVCLYQEKEKVYAQIVDYKTGKADIHLPRLKYGLSMQLFLYYYLLHKTEGALFAGVYLQPLLPEKKAAAEKKTYAQLEYDFYKLNGFTLRNKKIVELLDNNIENSYIKNMKIKTDGDFYYNAKVLTEEEIDQILKIIEGKINEAISDIQKEDFAINPKKIDAEEVCSLCPWKDICYRREEDVIFLSTEIRKEDVHE